MKSVSVIIARESEGRPSKENGNAAMSALSPVFFGGGFPLAPQMKLRMRIEMGPTTAIVNRQTKFSEEVL